MPIFCHIWRTIAGKQQKTAGNKTLCASLVPRRERQCVSARVTLTSRWSLEKSPDIPAPFCFVLLKPTETQILEVGKLGFCHYISYIFGNLSLKDLLAGISLTAIILFGQTSPGKMSMYGIDGNRSRCSHFWDDFLSCVYRVGRNHQWTQCANYREDYFECLHHKKLVSY